MQTCKCQSDIDELLYTSIRYDITTKSFSEPEEEYKTAYEHIEKISEILGKNLVFKATNFKSNMATEQQNVTYQTLISNLFGWTSRVPHMMINCFLRGDNLFVVQRGHETNTIDITNTKHTLPTITRTLERITWSSEADKTTTITTKTLDFVVSKHLNPFATYTDGDTTYTYWMGALESKITRHEDGGYTETEYEYSAGYTRLEGETETTVDKDGNKSVRYTRHFETNGQRNSRIYQDGEYQGSMEGNSGGYYGAIFLADSIELSRTEGEEVTYTTTIPGNPLIDPSFPLVEDDDLKAVTAELVKLNRKVREVITMEIYDLEHVIDFNDKIIFEGNEYFLQSNQVEKSERIINKQSISIVRWLF